MSGALPDAVEIFDTTLRDGAQFEGISLTVEDKLRVAEQLDWLGVAWIEGGYPQANPKDEEFFRRAAAGDEFADVRNFIEQRMPHEGPVHALLVSGVVGTVFFVAFCASLLIFSFSSVLKTPPKEVTPIQIWAVALLLPSVLGFFIVFGDYTGFFIGAIPVAALLYRFERLKTAARSAFSPEAEVDLRGSPPEMAWALHQPVGHPRQPPVS